MAGVINRSLTYAPATRFPRVPLPVVDVTNQMVAGPSNVHPRTARPRCLIHNPHPLPCPLVSDQPCLEQQWRSSERRPEYTAAKIANIVDQLVTVFQSPPSPLIAHCRQSRRDLA